MVRKPDRGESVVTGRENPITGTRSRETTDSQMKSATFQVRAPYYLFSLLGAGDCGGKTVPTLVSSVRYVLTGLLAGRFTRLASKPADAQTGLADTVDALASKPE